MTRLKAVGLVLVFAATLGCVGWGGAYIGTRSLASSMQAGLLFCGMGLTYGIVDSREDLLPKIFKQKQRSSEEIE